ncbi:MAG TPA: protein kinase [Gemmatimonas sp.]|nr:protein kinase [Gemmatimonas sp.]
MPDTPATPTPQPSLAAALADRYRIDQELGAGGMATVYRAHDVRHDRKVAVKVLQPELAAVIGAERFLREIKTIAGLQHPHIVGLLDSGQVNGTAFYVMPLMEGESLRDRLTREKQLPVADAVRIASEVAAAVDYAHRRGVIHRDIKPENVLLHDGSAMVADFGIALAVEQAGGQRMTQTGMSLGTPHYMSPEQAMGEREISARSDVYALGCVTYEMLTGDPPFTGSTAQAIVAKVLTERPRSLVAQRHTITPSVEAAVLTALEKLPADRFATAAEFATALADKRFTSATASRAAAAPARDAASGRLKIAALIGGTGFVAASALAAAGWLRDAPAGSVSRFVITLPEYAAVTGALSLSPDGSRFTYANAEGIRMRALSELTPTATAGTGEARGVVFSPDSRTIAFSTGAPGALKLVPLDGGTPRILVKDATYGYGLSWEGDWIYYLWGPAYGRDLMRIRASGGDPAFVARPDSARNELFFLWPQALPGGKKILLTVHPVAGDPSVGILEVASGKVTLLAEGSFARFSASGHLLVLQGDGTIRAAKFDVGTGAIRGALVVVADSVATFNADASPFTISLNGTLLYIKSGPANRVVRVQRDGRESFVDAAWQGAFQWLALAPDGSQLAIGADRSGRTELWLRSLQSGTFTRLSAAGTTNYRPSWSPDGKRIVFTSNQRGATAAYQVPADGSAAPSLLQAGGLSVDEAQFSADGGWLVFRTGAGAGRDISARRTNADTTARELVATKAEEFSPTVSPDGRWLAYASDETGRTEVYVRPFPDVSGGRFAVSRMGGSEPVWSRSGRELYYRDGDQRLVAAQIAAGAPFRIAGEQVLFSTRDYLTDNRHRNYTVAPDDGTFYFVKSMAGQGAQSQGVVTLNWFEELRQKVGR